MSGGPHLSAPQPTQTTHRRGGAIFVAAGILASRLFGLIRERVLAYYFGNSLQSAAYKAATRIPNFLQNLFGEGVLSGSFIPVYARLLEEKDDEEADRVAGAVFGLLTLTLSVLVLLGIIATPLFVDAIAPGFQGEARELTIGLVRILFPGTGLLVLSAWCLGILNSHRRFLLSYMAPVIWNVAIIGTLVVSAHFGGRRGSDLARDVSYGFVLGCFLQVAVQLPTVLRLLGRFRPGLGLGNRSVREVLSGFLPVVLGRGVVQVSAWVDVAYSSLISARAVSALNYAQTIYLIPVSVFGMSVSAAELPEMSRAIGTPEEVAAKLRTRIDASSRRIAYYVVPSAAAFLVLGDVIGGAVLQVGHFTAGDTRYLWYLLMGAAVGLVATTMGRLYSSAFYALRMQRIPLYYATVRVGLTAALAWWSAMRMPAALGLPTSLGAVGITATTGMAAWIEFILLRQKLQQIIGKVPSGITEILRLWVSAIVACAAGLSVKWLLAQHFGAATTSEWGGAFLPMPQLKAWMTAAVVLPAVAIVYGLGTWLFGIAEARRLVRRVIA